METPAEKKWSVNTGHTWGLAWFLAFTVLLPLLTNLYSVSTTGLKLAIEFGCVIKAEVRSTKGNKANLEVISEVSSFHGKGGSDFGEPKCKGSANFFQKALNHKYFGP